MCGVTGRQARVAYACSAQRSLLAICPYGQSSREQACIATLPPGHMSIPHLPAIILVLHQSSGRLPLYVSHPMIAALPKSQFPVLLWFNFVFVVRHSEDVHHEDAHYEDLMASS